jgi:hypothetical protein
MICRLVFAIAAVSIVLVSAVGQANSQVITATPRPLADAADLLERRYGRPVTYEDPALVWKRDNKPVRHPERNIVLSSVSQSFSMPVEADPNVTPVLDIQLLNKVIAAYHQGTNGPRFKGAGSEWGLHIVPSQVRNKSGRFTEERSLLDVPVTVPLAKRTPAEHLREMCTAVTAAAGTRLQDFAMYINELFVPSTVNVRKSGRFIVAEDLEKVSFEWGATNMVARQAVISLFEHSATTLSWRLLCDPVDGFCVLNVLPVRQK